MQEISGLPGQGGVFIIPASGAGNSARLIERIADERKARQAEMDADLVRAPGGDCHFEEGRIIQRMAADHPDVADRRPAAGE